MSHGVQMLVLGVVSEGPRLPAWQVRGLDTLLQVEGVDPAWAVVGSSDASGGEGLDRRVDASLGRFREVHLDGRDVRTTMRATPPDVVLWLSPAACPRDLASRPTHGVWAMEWASDGEGLRIARVVRLGATPADDRVLIEGVFRPESHADADAMRLTVAAWVPRLVRSLLKGRRLAGEPRQRVEPPVRRLRTPDWVRRLRGAGRTFHWNVGVVDAPIHAFLQPEALPPVRWLPDPGRRFWADPFAFEEDGEIVLVVEDYDYGIDQGRIATLRARGDAVETATALDVGVHMSYPYTFEHDGRRYCVPETSAADEVALYRQDGGRWTRVQALLPGFAGIDSTVFRHEGRWWLLCTNARDLSCTNLYAFWAEDLLGPWHPHATNPIKSDVRSARPAGTPFVHQGALYRPAQDCSRDYGGAVAINRVVELTPERFREEVAAIVRPDPSGPYPHGLHTLCAMGDRTVVDGLRWVRLVDDPVLVLTARAAMTFRRLRAS